MDRQRNRKDICPTCRPSALSDNGIQGRVTSFYGTELRRYTSLKAHKTGAVHQLLVSDKGIVALGSNYVHMSSRTGPTLWHLEYAPPSVDLLHALERS